MSYESTDSEAIILEQDNEETMELGNIAALFDGIIHEFDFRGLRVRRCGDSMEVTTQNEEPLGGYLLMESATIASAHDWLEAKADYYEGN